MKRRASINVCEIADLMKLPLPNRARSQVWDIVFQLSERLNVQIFATTHSRDCIKGFDRAWNNYPELGAFFRLDEKNGSIVATEYTSETLNDSIDMDVEVR